ncbi:MAG: 2-oxoglutarate dehydrogenase E1 component [candidate division Zixibacteria bacterium]|nr:2-oxoglutarate dehydrogenase E1 component [candidate division Zixibacteria bacterium]
MDLRDEFHGPNAAYVLELYERYLRDPNSVDEPTRAHFERWTSLPDQTPDDAMGGVSGASSALGASVANLAQAIREYGHLAAELDPLGMSVREDPALELETYGLTETRLRQAPATLVGGPLAERSANAFEAVERLRAIYMSTIGYDYAHIRVPEERDWLREAAEAGRFRPPQDPVNPVAILDRLTQIEAFEQFLHRTFPGKTRFSVEGLDTVILVLDEVIGEAAEAGILHIMIGMAHRGRLNVLAHTLNKSYEQILAEFRDPVERKNKHGDDVGWTGDVKYHSGARRALFDGDGQELDLTISLAPNPSHLEAVNPVLQGMARAAGTQVDRPGAVRPNPAGILPILIHGDAAFSGQGVVAETLTLSRVPGYRTGGTIHIISNNQLGYTTLPEQSRSTLYASDLAKGYEIPIVHVNADDPAACVEAARLAHAYRTTFQKDFLIDLIGYRRYGHNEGDEPGFTQPLLYKKIEKHPTVRHIWASKLTADGLIPTDRPTEMMTKRMASLQQTLDRLDAEATLIEPHAKTPPPGAARRVRTAVSLRRLQQLNRALWTFPDGFTPHPRLERVIDRRRRALDDPDAATIDWALAETLALASILEDGVSIRMTGEDVERGTFSQRHAVLHDYEIDRWIAPLRDLPQANAAFEIRNSPLSEYAALGFEYGYNVQAPERLVLWEAQYGDFIDGAQIVLDEFVFSARAKWGQTPSLVILLPHGFEGQGPDHSSGFLERFLERAADINMRIANCTNAAQYFHLLRRQSRLLTVDPLPLVVMTPKSLLRHPLVASSPREFFEGVWQPLIDDAEARKQPEAIQRLIFCSGKVYVDLVTHELRNAVSEEAIVRIEQLYPIRWDLLNPILDAYPNLTEVVWVQEEPENMGAWTYLRPVLESGIRDRWPLRLVARTRNSSPSEGSSAIHGVHQEELVRKAFAVGEAGTIHSN